MITTVVVRVVGVILAYFPAVFFHICNFDICHEIQHAVVTPYRTYQNYCSLFSGWNSHSGKLSFPALRSPIKEVKKRKSTRIWLQNQWAGFQKAGVARNALKCVIVACSPFQVCSPFPGWDCQSQETTVFGEFLTLFCKFSQSFTLFMHTKFCFKKIRPSLHFLAVMAAQTFWYGPGRVATAYSTDKYKYQRMKIRVSWGWQSTRVIWSGFTETKLTSWLVKLSYSKSWQPLLFKNICSTCWVF